MGENFLFIIKFIIWDILNIWKCCMDDWEKLYKMIIFGDELFYGIFIDLFYKGLKYFLGVSFYVNF